MKKVLLSLILGALLVTTFACSSSPETESTTGQTEDKSTGIESEYPFPDSASEIGGKKIVVSTAAGTTEDGNIPEELLDPDTSLSQIGLDLGDMEDEALNWNGDLEIFIYVNGIFVQREQTSSLMQTSIDLSDWLLKPGDYIVTAVQFENNDPGAGEVVNLTEVEYRIKN